MLEFIDFSTIKVPTSPNYYLVCPPQLCRDADSMSPIFNVDIATLHEAIKNIAAAQPRTKLLKLSDNHYIYEQRSQVWGFPDYIDIKLIPIDTKLTTLAIYSRSKYGYYDFKVNQKRVQSWLKQLQQAVSALRHK